MMSCFSLGKSRGSVRNPSAPRASVVATGKLMLSVVGAVGQAEREAMLERQREGIAKAKCEGRYKGHVPTARRRGDRRQRLSD